MGDFEPPTSFSFFDRAMHSDYLLSCSQRSKYEVLPTARSNSTGRFSDHYMLLLLSGQSPNNAVTFFFFSETCLMLDITYVGLLVVTRCTCVLYTFKSDCINVEIGWNRKL